MPWTRVATVASVVKEAWGKTPKDKRRYVPWTRVACAATRVKEALAIQKKTLRAFQLVHCEHCVADPDAAAAPGVRNNRVPSAVPPPA